MADFSMAASAPEDAGIGSVVDVSHDEALILKSMREACDAGHLVLPGHVVVRLAADLIHQVQLLGGEQRRILGTLGIDLQKAHAATWR